MTTTTNYESKEQIQDGPKLAVIGGSGVYNPDMLEDVSTNEIATPYGTAALAMGTYHGRKVAFLARHGTSHSVPPHKINYRANIWALKKLGVHRILATTAVGSINPDLPAGMFVLPSSYLDFTQGRINTFHDSPDRPVVHVDASEPFCPQLRQQLENICKGLQVPVHNGGTYVCTNGPRYETSAEIKMYSMIGGDVVGMTLATEAALAAEAEMCYVAISMVCNMAAGLSDTSLSHSEVLEVMDANSKNFKSVIMKALAEIDLENDQCNCAHMLAEYGGFKL